MDEYEEIGCEAWHRSRKKNKVDKKQKRARAKIQARQMKRLASGVMKVVVMGNLQLRRSC